MPIADDKKPAVARALMAAFGCDELDTISPLSGGMSGASIFKIRVGGISYLLRIEGSRDAFRDPHRWHQCMKIAAAGVIAPRVRYADPEDGVAIMDFIPEQSLAFDYRGTHADLVVEAAQTVRALHQGPAFPPLVDYMQGMEAVIAQYQATGLLAPEATAEVFARYDVLRQAYRTDPADLVASHNDLNPRNILYDGRRLWLVDWESAFQADRYVDLASLANFFTHDAAEEDALLRTYFGREPTARERARLAVMRQINHVFYGVVMLSSVAMEKPGLHVPGADLAGRGMAELHAGIGSGDFLLGDWQSRLAYGRSRLAAALAGTKTEDFDRAVEALVA